MIDFLLAHRFSWGAMAVAFTVGYTLGIVSITWLAYHWFCRPTVQQPKEDV